MNQADWTLSEDLKVSVKHGFLGSVSVRINDDSVVEKRVWGFTKRVDFKMPDGKEAQVVINTDSVFPLYELWLEHEVFSPDHAEKGELLKAQRVGKANGAIWILAILFAVSGIFDYLVKKEHFDAISSQLVGLDPAAPFPQVVNGRILTVAEVSRFVNYQLWGNLGVNLLLAGVMAVLAMWSKRSPMAAILMAIGVFLSVQFFNFAMDPSSLGRGVVIKLIVVGLLIKGVLSVAQLKSKPATPLEESE